ncbi:hypothetical protein WDU94_010820 [Cyamophila willieti]
MNIDDKLGDPRFIQEMDKLKEHADRLNEQMKSIQIKIDKIFESTDYNSEAQNRVSALQTERINKLVEFDETVDKFQSLLFEDNGRTAEANANIDDRDATQQNVNSKTRLGEDMDVKSETIGHKHEASSRMDENLTPFLKDMMDFDLSQHPSEKYEDDFYLVGSEFYNTQLEKELEEQKRFMAECDQTIAKLEEHKGLRGKMNTLQREPNVLSKSFARDILPLSKANLDKYIQELDTEINKTYKIIKEHLIEIPSFEEEVSEEDAKMIASLIEIPSFEEEVSEEDAKMIASFDQRLSNEKANNHLELFDIALELKDELDVCVRNDILHLGETDAMESASDIDKEIYSNRDSGSSDCIDTFPDVLIKTDSTNTSVVRNVCNPMGNTSVDHNEELPMEQDSSDQESSQNSQITVIPRKRINDNVHKAKGKYECEKFNISAMIEEITRRIIKSREKAEHVLDSKKRSRKICKPIGIKYTTCE